MLPAETPDIETSSAEYAARFSGTAGRYLLSVQSRSVAAAIDGLAPGTVLDVGGGHGQLVEPLRALGWRVTVHGTHPICETHLRTLHGRLDCKFSLGSLRSLPAADRSFDMVIAVRLLSHVTAWQQLLAEMCRVARHAIVLDYPSKLAMNALTPLLFDIKKSMEGNTRTYTSFSAGELQSELIAHRFGTTRQVKQFFLPMAVHRATRGTSILRGAEQLFRMTGLTAMFGSPVILRADRTA